MNNLPKSAVSPLTIATKLAAADNLTEPAFAEKLRQKPRLVELLWFLQWVTTQPGGMDKFALDVIAEFTPQFVASVLHDDSATLTVESRAAIWKSLPGDVKCGLISAACWMESELCINPNSRAALAAYDRRNFSGGYPDTVTPREKAAFNAVCQKLTLAQFRDAILDAARADLPNRLRSICEGPARWIDSAPWYCPKLIDVLFEAMAAHTARIELQLARTEVVSLAFDRLDYAWQQKVLVKIEGDARTGKSEAIKAYAAMYPGRARLVATPCSNSLRDLLLAVADAVGLPYTINVDTCDLKDHVQFIIRHSRLFLIFDEAHFLLPMSYGRNTNPARLDWVRTEIVDKGLPVALVCTPQAFKHGVSRFEKWTGYNFTQFFGRIMLNVNLPNELSESDLLAVTAIHGADIPENLYRFIATRAAQSDGYLKVIEAICKRARYIAKRDGHPAITRADVELAESEVQPGRARAPPKPAAPRQQPIAVKRTRPIRPAAVAPALQGPARHNSPAPALEAPARAAAPALETV